MIQESVCGGGGIYITYCVYNMYMKEKLSGSDAWRCSSSSNDGIFYDIKKTTSPRTRLFFDEHSDDYNQ